MSTLKMESLFTSEILIPRYQTTRFNYITRHTMHYRGTLLVAQLVEALRYKPEGRGFDS